jgi:hypothetical protein
MVRFSKFKDSWSLAKCCGLCILVVLGCAMYNLCIVGSSSQNLRKYGADLRHASSASGRPEDRLRHGTKFAQTLVHPAMIGLSPLPRRVLILSTVPSDSTSSTESYGNDVLQEVLKWDSVQEVFLLTQSSANPTPRMNRESLELAAGANRTVVNRHYERIGHKNMILWLQALLFDGASPRDLCQKPVSVDQRFDLVLVNMPHANGDMPAWHIRDVVSQLACSLSPHGALGMYVGPAPMAGISTLQAATANSLSLFQESLLRIEDLSFFFRYTRVYDTLLPSWNEHGEVAHHELTAFVLGLIPMLDKSDRLKRASTEPIEDPMLGSHSPGKAGISEKELETVVVPKVLQAVTGVNDFDGKSARTTLKLNQHILRHQRQSLTYFDGHAQSSYQHFSADWVSIYCSMPEIILSPDHAVRTPSTLQRRRICEIPLRISSVLTEAEHAMELRLTDDGMASSGVYATKLIPNGTLVGLYDAATR